MVTGMLPILRHYALVLFNFGSFHSFISSVFKMHSCLEVKPLGYVLSMSTQFGEIIMSNEKIKE